MGIKITFGVNNTVEKPAADYPTVGAVLEDTNLRQFLGFGSNIEAQVNGVSEGADYALEDGDAVDLVTRANKKG